MKSIAVAGCLLFAASVLAAQTPAAPAKTATPKAPAAKTNLFMESFWSSIRLNLLAMAA